MQTFFIRHTNRLDISETLRQSLWDQRRIAVHYPQDSNGKLSANDNESLNPADYEGKAKSVIGIFTLLGNEGGYVCAQYFGKPDLLIGIVRPKSKIKLLRGEWGSSSRRAVLKSLQLENPKTIHPRDHLVIAACRPQQGTISRWHAIGDTISSLIQNKTPLISWNSLTPTQQEVACSEFLRLPSMAQCGLPRLQSLLLPVGRTLNDVDIVGIATDGERLFAQVTYSKHQNVAWKVEKLRQIISPKKTHLILFCECDKPSIQDGIHIFPVREVFRVLNELPWGRLFLRGVTS
jgi:hypothetical protein